MLKGISRKTKLFHVGVSFDRIVFHYYRTFQPSVCPKCISKCLWHDQLISHKTHKKIYECCTKLYPMFVVISHGPLLLRFISRFLLILFQKKLKLWLLCWRLNEPSCNWLSKHGSSVIILIWFGCITRNISWLFFSVMGTFEAYGAVIPRCHQQGVLFTQTNDFDGIPGWFKNVSLL